MLAGNPDDPSTFFAGFPKDQVSPIASPDNLAFDDGHMWLAMDGQPDAIGFSDGFYAVPVEGDDRGHVRMFASVPRGADRPCLQPRRIHLLRLDPASRRGRQHRPAAEQLAGRRTAAAAFRRHHRPSAG